MAEPLPRQQIWHLTGRRLGAYRFAYDAEGVASLDELHADGWRPITFSNLSSVPPPSTPSGALVTVKDFGAAGDGSSCLEAFQASLASTGYAVVPAGQFQLEGTLELAAEETLLLLPGASIFPLADGGPYLTHAGEITREVLVKLVGIGSKVQVLGNARIHLRSRTSFAAVWASAYDHLVEGGLVIGNTPGTVIAGQTGVIVTGHSSRVLKTRFESMDIGALNYGSGANGCEYSIYCEEGNIGLQVDNGPASNISSCHINNSIFNLQDVSGVRVHSRGRDLLGVSVAQSHFEGLVAGQNLLHVPAGAGYVALGVSSCNFLNQVASSGAGIKIEDGCDAMVTDCDFGSLATGIHSISTYHLTAHGNRFAANVGTPIVWPGTVHRIDRGDPYGTVAVLAGLGASPPADVATAIGPAVAATSRKWLGGVAGEVENELGQVLGETVSILRFIPQNLHSAIRNGQHLGDLTPYFQAAFDRLNSDIYQSTILVPSGGYRIDQVIAKSGVSLYHPVTAGRAFDQTRPRITALGGGTAPSMFYSSATLSGFGLHGLFIQGRGTTAEHTAIDIANLSSFGFTGLLISSFGRQAINIPAGVEGRIQDVWTVNCGSLPNTVQKGVIDLGGTEVHLQDCELTGGVGAGGSGSIVSDTGDKNCCVVIRGSGNWLHNLICEFGEVGLVLGGVGQAHNHVVSVMADNCVGHGFIIASVRNTLLGCRAHRCGHNANDTYSGFEVTGQQNALIGCKTTGANDVNRLKYGFNDNSSGGFDLLANSYVGCTSHEHRTRGFHNAVGDRRGSFTMPLTQGVQSTIVGAAQSVSLDQLGFVTLDAAAAASVAAFTDGVKGQRCLIGFTNSNVTITHNASTLVCPGGTNIVGAVTALYEAVKMSTSKWILRAYG